MPNASACLLRMTRPISKRIGKVHSFVIEDDDDIGIHALAFDNHRGKLLTKCFDFALTYSSSIVTEC
jgi:hypothetical protein